MIPSHTVGREQAGYRRGVVLGLTMAEVILLLAFSILMSLAAVREDDGRRVLELEASLDIARKDLKKSQLIEKELANLVAQEARPDGLSPGEDWRELISDAHALRRQEEKGLRRDIADANAAFFAELADLNQPGRSSGDVIEAVLLIESLRTRLQESAQNNLELATLMELIQQGFVANQSGQTMGFHNWPPIITLSEANGYFFETGRADLSEKFAEALAGPVAKRLVSIIDEHVVDIVEVIGHTDEQPITPRSSNLDQALFPVVRGVQDVSTLVPADNAGLGFARAVSVAKVLMRNERLNMVTVLPLSAAQLTVPGDHLATGGTGDVRERRRIEIRVRRSSQHDRSPGEGKDTLPGNGAG